MINEISLRSLLKSIVLLIVGGLILIGILLAIIGFSRREKYDISLNGTLYVVNKADQSITVFDLKKGKEITTIKLGVEPREIAAIGENKLAFTNYGGNYLPGRSISILDAKTLRVERRITLTEGNRPYGVIKLPNDKSLATVTNGESRLSILNLERDSIEMVIDLDQKVSQLIVAHPNKPLVYVTNKSSGSVSVVDLYQRQLIKNIKSGVGSEGIDITPDGKEVWVANAIENTISIINTTRNQVDDVIETGKESYRVRFTLDGKYALVTSAQGGSIQVYDRSTRIKVKTIILSGKTSLLQRFLYHTPRPVGILMHPNRKIAFISNSNADKVEVLDLQSFAIIGNINTGKVPDGMAMISEVF